MSSLVSLKRLRAPSIKVNRALGTSLRQTNPPSYHHRTRHSTSASAFIPRISGSIERTKTESPGPPSRRFTALPSRTSLLARARTTPLLLRNFATHSTTIMSTPMEPTPSTSYDPRSLSPDFQPSLDHLDPKKPQRGYREAELKDGKRYSEFANEIEKSPNDDRDYRLIRLPNGLEALLIHDSKTDKASAALSVRVGHLSDPEETQGLAHFCEHMCFMGTEKYPKENEYSEYLSQNSGSSNAFTDMDQTNYFFDVSPTSLHGALDRFSQFFTTPLFDASCTEREAKAVDSENKKNLQSDMWRAFQLEKSLSNREKHAYWRFGTGNLETLWDGPRKEGRDVRDELIKFHDRFYSSNLMKLVVLGKDSLDTLTEWVVEMFSSAKNKNLPPPIFEGSPFTEKELKLQVYGKNIKDNRSLEIVFPFPDQDPFFSTQPSHFISHFLGHEGPGSILSHLKKKGWANGLYAGSGGSATGFDLFKINVDLTQDGLENHKLVALSIFKYIRLLKSTAPPEWAFREMKLLSEMGFRFREKSRPESYAQGMASMLHKPYPREWVISGPYILRNWDEGLVRESLALLDVERCRVNVWSQKKLEGVEWDKKERWYGTEYTVKELDQKIVKGAKEDTGFEDLALPSKNEFIAENLEIINKKEVPEPAKRPLLVHESPKSQIWHKKDDRWWVPRAAVNLSMRTPLVNKTLQDDTRVQIFSALLTDALNEYSYDADLAGLSYDLGPNGDSLSLSIFGYNDKSHVLLEVILNRMRNFQVDPKRFELILDQYLRYWKNFALGSPVSHAVTYATYLTMEKYYTPEEYITELENLKPEDVQEFIPRLFERMHIDALVHGNMLKDDAIKIVNTAEHILNFQPLTPEELSSPRSLLTPKGSDIIYHTDVPNPENLNSAIEYFCYVGDAIDRELVARVSLFAQLVNEPCFHDLRTTEQLGYIVQSGVREAIGMTGIRVIIQSEKDPMYLEGRIDAFWDRFGETLEKMGEEEFVKQRQSVVDNILEDVKNLAQEARWYWRNIRSGYYDFYRKKIDAEHILKLNKQDMIQFFKEYIHPSSTTRAKLSVHLRSQRVQPEAFDKVLEVLKAKAVDVKDEEGWKKFVSDRPTVPEFQKFAGEKLAEAGASDEVKKEVDAVIGALLKPPTPPKEGVKVSTDAVQVRKGQILGPSSKPVEDFKDYLANL